MHLSLWAAQLSKFLFAKASLARKIPKAAKLIKKMRFVMSTA